MDKVKLARGSLILFCGAVLFMICGAPIIPSGGGGAWSEITDKPTNFPPFTVGSNAVYLDVSTAPFTNDFVLGTAAIAYSTGTELKMAWDASKYALRAGSFSSAGYLEDAVVGGGSFGIGLDVKASGVFAVAMGNGCLATADYSEATGIASLAYLRGQRARSSFATSGIGQHSTLTMGGEYLDTGTQDIAYLNGSSNSGVRAVIPTETSWFFTIKLIGRTATNLTCAHQIRGIIQRTADTTALVGTPVYEDIDTSEFDGNPVVSAEDSGDYLGLTVTPSTGVVLIRWTAVVDLAEVTY